MKARFLVMGAGAMGRAVALDLASATGTGQVVVADADLEVARAARAFVASPKVRTARLDVSDEHDRYNAEVQQRWRSCLHRGGESSGSRRLHTTAAPANTSRVRSVLPGIAFVRVRKPRGLRRHGLVELLPLIVPRRRSTAHGLPPVSCSACFGSLSVPRRSNQSHLMPKKRPNGY